MPLLEIQEKQLKATANQIMQEARPTAKIIGLVFETYGIYIKKRLGEEGIKQIEDKLVEIGYPFCFQSVNSFEYYPLGYSALILVLLQELFNWTEKDIFEMGYTAPQYSLLIRIFMRYFLDLKKMAVEAQNNWKKHFTEGRIEFDLKEKEKYLIMRLSHQALHPLICVYAAGFFLRILKYVIKSSEVDIQEMHCAFKEKLPFHEYMIKWQ
ncbi:MAG: hypothetical protein PHW31_03505 [Candidatus Pacebacteria bacterium]|nr:hypothetical protein [Candidatus Paceibacterota bacterium]